jgi:hypothetical protein
MSGIDPTRQLIIELEAREWDVVMTGLSLLQQHAGAVANKIARQAREGVARPNGLAKHDAPEQQQ